MLCHALAICTGLNTLLAAYWQLAGIILLVYNQGTGITRTSICIKRLEMSVTSDLFLAHEAVKSLHRDCHHSNCNDC